MHDQVVGHDEVLLMALTFGTLLSSQGADAHHLGPFGPVPGQPTKPYSVGFARSNLTGTARLPAWSAGADNHVARTWGMFGRLRLAAPCAEQHQG